MISFTNLLSLVTLWLALSATVSRDFQLHFVISLFFYLYLMFYTCVQRFDGIDKKFLGE